MLDEHFVPVEFVSAEALLGILAKVYEFDDIWMVYVGPAYKLGMIGLHLVLRGVLDSILVDEFLRDGIAICGVVDLHPVLDQKA